MADAIAAAFALDEADTVLDLGCGTGQLTVPLAARAGTVIGMDPEPDMLALAAKNQIQNARWVRATDRDLASQGLTGLAAVTVAVAIHWMDRDALSGRSARCCGPAVASAGYRVAEKNCLRRSAVTTSPAGWPRTNP